MTKEKTEGKISVHGLPFRLPCLNEKSPEHKVAFRGMNEVLRREIMRRRGPQSFLLLGGECVEVLDQVSRENKVFVDGLDIIYHIGSFAR